MALNEKEKTLLADLLNKADNTEIHGKVWYALVKRFITTPIELCIINDKDEVFLVRRAADDPEFKGRPYHMPGTVVNDWETVVEARKRLIQDEVIAAGLIGVTNPESIGWIEIGRNEYQLKSVSTRHGIILPHIAHFHGIFVNTDEVAFFPIDALPENMVESHVFLISLFKKHLADGTIFLDN